MFFNTSIYFIALRYLKPSKDQGMVSIISLFSFLGIVLGVGTLIVVMSVMNGFRIELLDKIIGINEKLFYKFQKEIFKNQDISKIELGDFEFGSKYSYIMTQVFSGLNAEKAKFIDLKGKYKSKFDSFRDRLVNAKFTQKLKKITKCENLSYEKIIQKYDSSTTYFYVDPPYWKTENYYSLHDFDVEDHKKLCNLFYLLELCLLSNRVLNHRTLIFQLT